MSLDDSWQMLRARLDKALVQQDEFDKKFAAKDILSFTLVEQVWWIAGIMCFT